MAVAEHGVPQAQTCPATAPPDRGQAAVVASAILAVGGEREPRRYELRRDIDGDDGRDDDGDDDGDDDADDARDDDGDDDDDDDDGGANSPSIASRRFVN